MVSITTECNDFLSFLKFFSVMVAVVPLSLSVTAFLSLPAHYMHTTLSFLFSCLSSLSRVFVSLFVFLCLLTATHMGWHRIKHYSMDK